MCGKIPLGACQMTERSIMYTLEAEGKQYAVAVRNGSVNVELLPNGLKEGQTHVVRKDISRTRSAPCLCLWTKPWDEPRAAYLHRIGQCVPCFFSARKADGCRKGSDCTHCHLCTVQDLKRRKRQLQAQAKAASAARALR
ncbi:unnamed protein product [Effrenium voratum]|nr:unnamed protein product [Effrenium voratum]